jgi:hypothetical protein
MASFYAVFGPPLTREAKSRRPEAGEMWSVENKIFIFYSNSFKVAMLTARMTFPTIFGFLSVMLICAGIWFRVGNAFGKGEMPHPPINTYFPGWYCAFSAFAITHGFQNV